MNNKKVKHVVVTGGTRGLGLSHVEFLAQRGYDISIIDISRSACQVYGEVSTIDDLLVRLRSYGVNSHFFSCDLTDLNLLNECVERIINEAGDIDAIVANVGGDVVGRDQSASGAKATNNSIDISSEQHNEVFDRNYLTCFNTIKAIVPYFKQRNKGKIVTTTSISAGYGVPQETAYAVAKSAVLHLTRCVATELRPYGINVNCIAPGATLTGRFNATLSQRSEVDRQKITATTGSFLEKPAKPESISSVVEFLLSSASDYISGQVIRIDGGQFTSPI
jgi:3-oxoacyl-[acyl-carrier protein] reductase